MMHSGLVVLIIVLFNLTSMLFCFRDLKGTDKGKKPMPVYQIYILSSVFFAALGVLMCVVATNYRANDKKFILLHVLILAIQITVLTLLIIYTDLITFATE